jgi:hypothetical protein
LYAASRAFVRSLAEDALQVPPAELLRAVFPTKDNLKVCLYETDELRHCSAFTTNPLNHDLADRCLRPVLPGQKCCEYHKYEHPSVQLRIEPPVTWTALKPVDGMPRLYVTGKGDVVTAKGDIVGKYDRDTGALQLFQAA